MACWGVVRTIDSSLVLSRVMAFDEFHQTLHLTPRGWITSPADDPSIPPDCVLSVHVTIRQHRQFDGHEEVSCVENWRADSVTDQFIAELKSKYRMPV